MVYLLDDQDQVMELHLGNDTWAYGLRETMELTSISKTQIEWNGCTNKINIVRQNHSDCIIWS
jgi:hypothetical protein